VRYELLLQTADPGTPYAAERVKERFVARGLAFAEDGSAKWNLKAGVIEVRPLKEGGVVVATELRVPLSDKTDLMRELLSEASTVAEEAKVRLFDPQLTRGVSIKDDGAVSDQFFRTAKYAGEMLGVSEAIGASFAPPETGLKPGTKVLLGMVGVIVLLYFIAEHMFPK
jgi:hypothetical protein